MTYHYYHFTRSDREFTDRDLDRLPDNMSGHLPDYGSTVLGHEMLVVFGDEYDSVINEAILADDVATFVSANPSFTARKLALQEYTEIRERIWNAVNCASDK